MDDRKCYVPTSSTRVMRYFQRRLDARGLIGVLSLVAPAHIHEKQLRHAVVRAFVRESATLITYYTT